MRVRRRCRPTIILTLTFILSLTPAPTPPSLRAGYTCEWFASLSLFFSALGYFKLAAAYREADPALATYTAVDEVTYTPLPGAEAMNNDASNVMVYSNPNPTPVVVAGAAAEETCGFAFKHPPQPDEAGPLTPEDEASIALVASLFKEHVDVKTLVDDLTEASAAPAKWVRELPSFPGTDDGEGEAADAAADGANGSKRPRK